MNRIAIGCLALTLAGCCNHGPQDERLVGVWVLDTLAPKYCFALAEQNARDVWPNGLPVLWLDEDGMGSIDWSFDLVQEEIVLNGTEHRREWGTLDDCEFWGVFMIPDSTSQDPSGYPYKVTQNKLVLNPLAGAYDESSRRERRLAAFHFWRYD